MLDSNFLADRWRCPWRQKGKDLNFASECDFFYYFVTYEFQYNPNETSKIIEYFLFAVSQPFLLHFM